MIIVNVLIQHTTSTKLGVHAMSLDKQNDFYLHGLQKTAAMQTGQFSALANNIKDVTAITTPLLGVAALTTFGIKAILNKIQNDTRRKALIEDLLSNDPIIKEADKTKTLEYYATIYNIAPTVSLEKPVVRELLQHFVKFGRIDLATIKTLSETEEKTNSAQRGGTSIKDMLSLKL